MERNMGLWDRGLRIVAGILLLGLYGALEPPLKYFTLLGLVLVATGATGRCPCRWKRSSPKIGTRCPTCSESADGSKPL